MGPTYTTELSVTSVVFAKSYKPIREGGEGGLAEASRTIIWINIETSSLMNNEHHLEKRALPVCSPTNSAMKH